MIKSILKISIYIYIFDLIENEDCEKSRKEMKNQLYLHTNMNPQRKKIIVYI